MPNLKHTMRSNKRMARICRVGSLVIDQITPICQRHGFIQARILLEWTYIVTPEFAQYCIPIKVSFPTKQRNNGRLLLKVSSSMATEISYLEPLILNRINQYFGYQAISKITLQQGPVITNQSLKTKSSHRLSATTQSSIADKLHDIDDERLRAALLSLGLGISQKGLAS